MDADIHAWLLMAVFPLGVLVLGVFGRRPKTGRDWLLAPLLFVGAFLLVFIVRGFSEGYAMCGPSSALQWTLPAILGGMCTATARTWKIRFGLIVLFIVIGMGLGSQYLSLLRLKEQYVGLDNGHPYITCTKPVTAVKLWHSWYTGIYGLVPK